MCTKTRSTDITENVIKSKAGMLQAKGLTKNGSREMVVDEGGTGHQN